VTIHIRHFEIDLTDATVDDAVVLTFNDESTLFLTPTINESGEMSVKRSLTVHPLDMPTDLMQRLRRGAKEIVDDNSNRLTEWYDGLSHEEISLLGDELLQHILEIPLVLGAIKPGKTLMAYGHCPYPMSGFEMFTLRWESASPVIDARVVTDPEELAAARARLLE
jgi:hypothetical protein